MLLILPVKSLLLYITIGATSYALTTWLMTSNILEIIMFCSAICMASSIGCLLLLDTEFSEIEDKDKDKDKKDDQYADPMYCMKCGKSYGFDSDAMYAKQHRIVVERDGTMVITTIFKPSWGDSDDESLDSSVDEIRENLSKEELLPSPVEETSEFADLLNKIAASE